MTSATCQHQQYQHQQVRAGHVTKGYHRLQQDEDATLQPAVTSDSEHASPDTGSASDELELVSDISKHQSLLIHCVAFLIRHKSCLDLLSFKG